MYSKNIIIEFDAIVIGSGIQGLLLAYRLVELGQKVAVIEKSHTLANGASIKNHGWIHQGTTHALSAKDVAQGREVVKRLQYGHQFFKSYAPECFDTPGASSYAVTNDPSRAAFARQRWAECNVPFKELSAEQYFALEPDINRQAVSYFFEVADGRLNNRLLLMKLYSHIKSKGALILTGSSYDYLSDRSVVVNSDQGDYELRAPLFFYATGANTDKCYHKLTGLTLGFQCFKCHLLFTPQLSRFTLIDLDYSSPIIVNHGDTSVINRSHDEVPSSSDDYKVNEQEIKQTIASVKQLFPQIENITANKIAATACLKPCLIESEQDTSLSIEPNIFEPKPGHIFALPGKMTAAPYVTDEIIKMVAPRLNLGAVTARPFEYQTTKTVAPRRKASIRYTKRPIRRLTIRSRNKTAA